jgi:hypothetical protein
MCLKSINSNAITSNLTFNYAYVTTVEVFVLRSLPPVPFTIHTLHQLYEEEDPESSCPCQHLSTLLRYVHTRPRGHLKGAKHMLYLYPVRQIHIDLVSNLESDLCDRCARLDMDWILPGQPKAPMHPIQKLMDLDSDMSQRISSVCSFCRFLGAMCLVDLQNPAFEEWALVAIPGVENSYTVLAVVQAKPTPWYWYS